MLNNPAVWYLMRATGVVSTLLLTIVVALGIGTSLRWKLAGLPRAVTVGVHRSASLLAVVFIAIHVATAVIDPDAAVGLVSLVVPFAGSANAFWVGLGALSVDLIAAVLVTSLLRRHFSRRIWRAVHWLAYAAWPLAIVHGIGMGTDTGTAWLTVVTIVCIAAVGTAVTWRLYGAGEPAPTAATRQRAGGRQGPTARGVSP